MVLYIRTSSTTLTLLDKLSFGWHYMLKSYGRCLILRRQWVMRTCTSRGILQRMRPRRVLHLS